MSAQLVARGLRAAHGTRVLFDDLDFVVAPGDRIGLVGPNGAGKSTLLRILAGVATAEAGATSLSPATATVGLLPQQDDAVAGETITQHLSRRVGVTEAQRTLDAATAALASNSEDPSVAGEYDVALRRWLALGGAELDHRAAEALHDVDLHVDPDHPMVSLSGGQAARVRLAALLLSRHDVLLLDEPTNDLDPLGLERLERFVAEVPAGMVLVSHDREFLDRTITSVVEIDSAQQQVTTFGGGWQAWLEERERARDSVRERWEAHVGEVDSLRARARRERDWSSRGVRNEQRSPVDGDKIGRKRRIETTEALAGRARRTERRIQRLVAPTEPRREWDLRFSIAAAPLSGTVVATLTGATVRRDGFTLGPVSLAVYRGDRVAITGPNGAGKSTLLALLTGALTPDEGAALLGSGVLVGSVDQARAAFGGTDPLMEVFSTAVPDWPSSEARTLLAKFSLGAEHVGRSCASLSPGERTRASLALLQAEGVNLLVLDEPTNHLDLPAIEELEQALADYDGTLLLVSHDRRLLRNVAHTRHLAVQAGEVEEVAEGPGPGAR